MPRLGSSFAALRVRNFAILWVGSLGTFSTRFSELVGVSPSSYRREHAEQMLGVPTCETSKVTRPVRNREAPVGGGP